MFPDGSNLDRLDEQFIYNTEGEFPLTSSRRFGFQADVYPHPNSWSSLPLEGGSGPSIACPYCQPQSLSDVGGIL